LDANKRENHHTRKNGIYAYDAHWSFHGSVMNAFNRAPPVDLETYGGSSYNPSLHQAGAVGRYFVAGATYQF
jgi:iron complex outermembrane receptor protein